MLGLEIYAGACLDFSGSSSTSRVLALFIPMLISMLSILIYVLWYCIASSTDTEPMEPKTPSLAKKTGACIGSPKFCCSCSMPCYEKPEEYFTTWLLTDFLLTWPWNPRAGDRRITKTDRFVVMLMIILTDLVIFLFCSYGIGKFYTAATGEESEALSAADTSLVRQPLGRLTFA